MNSKKKTLKLAIILTAILFVVTGFIILKIDPFYLHASNDENLISLFHQHRTAFVKLEKMITEDRVSYVSNQYTNSGLTRERWRMYNSLISEISHDMVITYSPEAVRFVFSRGGLMSIGPEWVKGIEYTNNSESVGTFKKTLDNPGELSNGNVYLRKIEHGWFIFFQKSS